MKHKQLAHHYFAVALAGVVGCAAENTDLADYAMESARWQAEQSQTLIEAQHDLADGSRGLVTADAVSRQELATLQRELRADQAELAQQYQSLAASQADRASSQHRDAQVAAALLGLTRC